MRIARVQLFSLFDAMLFLLNLLTSNVIYHNICILSTLILRNLMYLKSIDELPAPFPLPAFITYHSLSLPSVAFHCLSSPFIQYLPSPFNTFRRLSLPFIAAPSHCPPTLCSPVLSSSRPVLSSPRPTLSPCHRFTLLLPSCFITPLCFTHPSFTHLYFLPLCFIYSRCFASFDLLPPPLLYSLPLFCTRFFTPRQPPQTRPRHRKRQRFSRFSKKFCKKPLTKQKKVLY